MRIFAASILCLLIAVPAKAATPRACTVEQVASIDLLMGPRTNALFVSATLNGTQKYFIVDTGGIHSSLTFQVTRELALPTSPSTVVQQNVAGQATALVATVNYFGLGSFPPGRMQFMVDPPNDVTMRMGSRVAGTLAPSILRQYDVEFDLAAAKMNMFKPSRCIKGPYWDHTAAASIDLEVGESGHIFFPMMLDGHRVHTALDTGMSITTLRADTGKAIFGIDPQASHLERVGSLTGDERGMIYNVALHTLATERSEVSVSNPHLHLIPDLTTGRRMENEPQLILGLSTLKYLHIYIAYNMQKLFVTGASGPPAVTLTLSDLQPPAPPAPPPTISTLPGKENGRPNTTVKHDAAAGQSPALAKEMSQ